MPAPGVPEGDPEVSVFGAVEVAPVLVVVEGEPSLPVVVTTDDEESLPLMTDEALEPTFEVMLLKTEVAPVAPVPTAEVTSSINTISKV
jgi:hypothetical protein